MFESDDWDLDQDFLNDVDKKSHTVCFATDRDEVELKRRKIEVSNHSVFSSNTDVDRCEQKSINTATTQCIDKTSRKNLILGMFNKNLSNSNVSQKSPRDNMVQSESNMIKSSNNSQLPRKNLVLEILKKKSTDGTVIENNTKNLVPRNTELKAKSNSNTHIQEQESSKVKHQPPNKNAQRKSDLNNDILKRGSYENSRKQLLVNLLKQHSMNIMEHKNKSVMKAPQAQSNKKMTLVRRFPGPAGLLPDGIEASVLPISYLNSLDESEETKESNEADLPEYCSQNTKDLFTEGAWQLMLDDLPNDFLKGYEIATVKQMANTNGYNCTKIDFLAGVVERIDNSHENPPIVLKDFTDSIQGIVHRDIPLKYPGLLESNVVILLHDVGLLKTSKSLVSNRYHILISPSSLLAIYSSKGKIERTRYMESILGNVSNGEMEPDATREDRVFSKILVKESQKVLNDSHKKISKFGSSIETFGNESIGIDLTEEFSFSVPSNEITDKQNTTNFVCSASTSLRDTKKEDKQRQSNCTEKSKNLVDSLKRFSHVSTSEKFSRNSRSSRMDMEHPVSTSTRTEEATSEMLCDNPTEKMDIDEEDINRCPKETESEKNGLYRSCFGSAEKTKLPVRSKLMKFKNADVLTPPRSSESNPSLDSNNDNDIDGQKKSSENPNSVLEILCAAENDSDDEMLSQIDMDSILTNYNNKD
ncbi:PREDICTED: uncharacterized protein LOC107189939 [Dufourea novaeangliae]|uniref:Uncharacterized protein C17orf53 like protein n=1 Tax=Dufourea novaeangliae TaxID=178035 RepID=A0A154PIZ4_DUFNO|nr:PREDICTED: uncharacterized protein LOC107189939 [Dufourea novaeangliae]KZC11792.1 Uncharacterized protein C17orf53 like protein [Dufourea novaeangliae]